MLKWFNKQRSSESSVKDKNQQNEDLPTALSLSDLSDADYEFLFNQLLDGVAHGWNQLKVIKFFENLGTRGEEAHWVAWLEKFSAKIPDVTNDSQRRLGAIMLRLAEVTQSAAELNKLSAVSSQIGKKLFFGKTANLIWEYDGLDLVYPPTPTEDSQIEENVTSISETIPESTTKDSSEPKNPESQPPESSATATPESTTENSSEIKNPESQPPESSATATPESTTKNSSEIKNPESQPPESSATATPESTIKGISPEATTADRSSEDQKNKSDLINQTKNAEDNSSNHSIIALVESWFNLGLKQANAGDLLEAIESWHKALELNPNLAEIWHNLGSALGRLEHYPEAIDSFDHALEIDPQSYQAWNDRAHAYYQMGKWEQAIDSWHKAIAIKPKNYQFWFHHGCALEQLQRFDDAMASYAKALEISPDFQLARSKYVNLITES